jgi:hypothetical protein
MRRGGLSALLAGAALSMAGCTLPRAPTAVPELASAPPGAPAESLFADRARLEASEQRWAQVKAAWGGHYHYRVSWRSAFGFGHQTQVEVRGDQVVARWFKNEPGPQAPEPIRVIRETGSELGRQGAPAAPPLTLDQLYTQCRALINRPLPAHESQHLALDERGLLRGCVRVDRRFTGDAPTQGVPELALAPGPGQPLS